MIHIYDPTISAPNNDSPQWYKNYHNSFYLCQLVNRLLLSYMDSFIEIHEKFDILSSERKKLIDEGILIIDESSEEDLQYVDDTKLYSIAVESFLEELVLNFKQKTNEINTNLMCMGISAGDYFDKEISINLNELLDSIVINDWYKVVKGFLNVWEFMFLFSLVESSLKTYISNNIEKASELLNEVSRQHPELLLALDENCQISSEFLRDAWSLYTTLRNVYSHTHGVISDRHKKRLTREIQAFRISYNKSFHSPSDASGFIISELMNKSCELFSDSNIIVGKFYLIDDSELNIFRNFTSKMMYELSKVD